MPEAIKKLIGKHPYLLVFLAAAAAWLPVVFVPFINDDYQILGFHMGKGWISVFRPFYTPDVSNFYWRPLGNLLHPLILLTAGFHPLAFRIASLVLYGLCCVLVAKTGESLGLSRTFSTLAAIFFSVLPSHEYQVAWIADHGESLVTIVLLAAFYYYMKAFKKGGLNINSLFLFYLLLLAAALIKESAFAGILIPLTAVLAERDLSKKRILTALRDIAVGFAIVICILAYRWYFIGGSPFSSTHFAHSGVSGYILNFFVYIPLSFFSPESLEIAAGSSRVLLLIAALILIIPAYFLFIYRRPVSFHQPALWKLSAAVSWFIIFIIPGLPTLMRWYVFTASIGLVWTLAVLGENTAVNSFSQKVSFGILIVLILLSSVYDFSLMLRWSRVGKSVDHALSSLGTRKSGIKTDSLYVWATPDKLTRIPMMKLGIQESVQWGLKDKNLTVITPLRAEMSSFQSRISLVEKTDTSLVFHISDGRFLPYGGESRAVIKNESTEENLEGIRLKIRTFLDESNIPQSIAGVYFPKAFRKPQMYFDGKEFQKVE